MAGYKTSPVIRRLLRRQKIKQAAQQPTAPKPKEKTDGKDSK